MQRKGHPQVFSTGTYIGLNFLECNLAVYIINLKMCITFNSAIPPLEIYPSKIIKNVHKDLSQGCLYSVILIVKNWGEVSIEC